MKKELKKNRDLGTKNDDVPTSRTVKTTWMQGKFVNNFNAFYEFSSRLVKVLLFLVILGIVIWKLSGIDLKGTSSKLINNYTPIVLQPLSSSPMEDKNAKDSALPVQPSRPTDTIHRLSPNPSLISEQTVKTDYLAVYQFGQLIFTVDKPYAISGDLLTFDKLLLKGEPNYHKPFLYGGVEIRITQIKEYIGLLISGNSVEGPVLKGVSCRVIHK